MSQKGQRPDAGFERAVVDCVVRSVPDVSLDQMRESPDADLLHKHGYHVGLEIVRSVDQMWLDTNGRLQAATREIQQYMAEQQLRVSIDIYFDLDEMDPERCPSPDRAWHRATPAKIAALVRTSADGRVDTGALKARGIMRIARIEWSQAPNLFVGCGWYSRRGATLVGTCLERKHERLRYYRTTNGDHFREYWLAIAGFGPGTLEDGGFSMLLSRKYETDYDRVFLIEDGSGGAFVKAHDVTPATRSTPRVLE